MTPSTTKNKTFATWLALLFGQLGLHRFYLFGWTDLWAWAHPLIAAIGWYGVVRVQQYGQDDQIAWLLIPWLGFTLAAAALTAIYYGLMAPEKWTAQHNPNAPDGPDAPSGRTNWLTMGAIVLALLFGTITLMSSLAFSFQRYFEYQVEEARKISQ
ncbi:membrane protein [Polaromonas sp.]|nr:membrane protein [Polaromonas sp.]